MTPVPPPPRDAAAGPGIGRGAAFGPPGSLRACVWMQVPRGRSHWIASLRFRAGAPPAADPRPGAAPPPGAGGEP
ncbi:MAG TPA: hypothetical protein VF746_01055 [Longimicrobium sp.]|jgi:hypothetical protein